MNLAVTMLGGNKVKLDYQPIRSSPKYDLNKSLFEFWLIDIKTEKIAPLTENRKQWCLTIFDQWYLAYIMVLWFKNIIQYSSPFARHLCVSVVVYFILLNLYNTSSNSWIKQKSWAFWHLWWRVVNQHSGTGSWT